MAYSLGRLVEHDERSRAHEFASTATAPKTVLWGHSAPVLDQGQVGSCTGNALAQFLNTDFAQGLRKGILTEADALKIYSLGTTLDTIPGSYPPDDTGSSGLAVCKAGVQLGYLTSYQHVFGFNALLLALQHTPVIVGTEWLKNMFTPNQTTDVIRATGAVEGGHEYLILGCDVENQFITMLNSWSSTWGVNGRAKISFKDFQKLLAAQGDVTVPVIK